MIEQRLLPQAVDAEEAVLGALLLMPEAWVRCAELLRPELFHVEANRQVFRVASELRANDRPVDTITVATRLRAEGLLDGVGGAYYLTKLTGRVSGMSNLEYHSRILIEQFIARSLIRIGHDAEVSGYSSSDALALLDRISGDISDLYGYIVGSSSFSAATGISELTKAKDGRFYPFGIDELDRMAVMQPGLPYVFAGRPGMGKSILAVHVMWNLTQLGNVLLFSPEMTIKQVQSRIIASECGVPYSDILRGRLGEQQEHDVKLTSERLADRLERLKIDPSSGITPDQMRVRTERAMKRDGVLVVGVDHLHKMKTGDKRVDREETARVSQCMEGVTELAKNTMLPALAMCQLNREVEKRQGKKPSLADLKQTGKIEEDAAFVGLLYRQGYYEEQPPYEDTLEISVAKNRDGDVGLARTTVTPALSRIGINFHKPNKAPF